MRLYMDAVSRQSNRQQHLNSLGEQSSRPLYLNSLSEQGNRLQNLETRSRYAAMRTPASFADAFSQATKSVTDTASVVEAPVQGGNTSDILMAILLYLLMSTGDGSMNPYALSGMLSYGTGTAAAGTAGDTSAYPDGSTSGSTSSGTAASAANASAYFTSKLPTDLSVLGINMPVNNPGQYSEVVQAAMTRLGDPYSQPKAGQGDYTDCSYLSRWCYRTIGVEIPRTAAAQAKFCVDNNMTISKEELRPGDLIFFSLHDNDRFMDITHVGIYAGNGMMVDASMREGEVVYRRVFEGQVLYGRPR